MEGGHCGGCSRCQQVLVQSLGTKDSCHVLGTDQEATQGQGAETPGVRGARLSPKHVLPESDLAPGLS